MTWIALLRGINVSGQRPVPMARLRQMLADSGLRAAKTYLQSGNVVFAAAGRAPEELASALEAAIEREFGFAVPVILRRAPAWKKLVAANPFLREPAVDSEKLHVTFLAEAPDPASVENLAALPASADFFRRHGREIYLSCPGGYGRTKLTNAVFERKLGVGATTRNWRTVLALEKMAAEVAG